MVAGIDTFFCQGVGTHDGCPLLTSLTFGTLGGNTGASFCAGVTATAHGCSALPTLTLIGAGALFGATFCSPNGCPQLTTVIA